jgi:hypothetical protein
MNPSQPDVDDDDDEWMRRESNPRKISLCAERQEGDGRVPFLAAARLDRTDRRSLAS